MSAERIVSPDVLPEVNEETLIRLKQEFENRGYQIFTMKTDSIDDIIAADDIRETEGKPRRVGKVDDKLIRPTKIPRTVEVAVKLDEAHIQESYEGHTKEHLDLIRARGEHMNDSLPPDLQGLTRSRMPTSSHIIQIKDAHQQATGNLLFDGIFIRTSDVITGDGFARVGHYPKSEPLWTPGITIRGRDGRQGVNDVFELEVFELPRARTARPMHKNQ